MNKVYPAISIVIATAPGRMDKLKLCLKSIDQSTYRSFEVIVVDNSNIPTTSQWINSRYPYMKTLRMPNNTGIFAYNVGFANASGEFIFLLDDDCVIFKDTLKKIVESFNKQPKTTGVITLKIKDIKSDYYGTAHLDNLKILYIPSFAGGASIIRKSVFDKVGYFDADFFCWEHEEDLAIKILNAGYRIYFDKNITILHDEKVGRVVRQELFMIAHNKAWVNIKHFSLYFIPLLMLRDMAWILLRKSIKGILYGVIGYALGYLQCMTPLKKRRVTSIPIQKFYIKYYLFGKYIGKFIKEDQGV